MAANLRLRNTAFILFCAYGSIATNAKRNFKLLSVEDCPGSGDLNNLHISHKIMDDSSVSISGDITTTYPTDEKYSVAVHIDKWVKGKYLKDLIEYSKDNFCESASDIGNEMLREFIQSIKTTQTCPIAPGTYKLQDFVINMKKLPNLPLVGKYRARIELAYDGKTTHCIRFMFENK